MAAVDLDDCEPDPAAGSEAVRSYYLQELIISGGMADIW